LEGIFLDTNVLLDVVTDAGTWADWSQSQLEVWSLSGSLFVNDVVYAEFSVGYRRVEEVDAALADMGVELVAIPRAALFLAGKAFRSYRAAGGTRGGVLPDFFIGAHAAVAGVPF
jgi:predicted nucleic acid-binding protein